LSADTAFLRHLVDVVWGVAHEDGSVPDSHWAERMIQDALDTFRGSAHAPSAFDVLDHLVAGFEAAGHSTLALDIRASFARATGGVDSDRIVELLVGATPPVSSFADHPESVSKLRASRTQDAADLTPRDVLIGALRGIDAADFEAEHLIVVVGTSPRPGTSRTLVSQGGRFGFHAQLGLLTRAASILPEKE
jgi:hypothetical protein